MSNEADHIALANRFQVSIDFMLGDVHQCVEWLAVAAFYKALHVVEAAFYNDPAIMHTSNHGDRSKRLKSKRKYSPLFPSYNALWSASTIARYLQDRGSGHTYAQFSDFLPADQIRPRLLDRYLPVFETMSVQLITNPSSLVRYRSVPSIATAQVKAQPTANQSVPPTSSASSS
jgi:hypothetical protein